MRMSAVRTIRVALVAIWLGAFTIDAIAREAQIEAVWKQQRATFSFVGHATSYSCSELESRLRRILVVLGAHEEMYVDRRECSSLTELRLHIAFISPVEATVENVRALTTFATEDQLIARLNGVELPAPEDLRRFPAEWQPISLSRDRRLRLSAGDCELIEQIRRQLVPRLATRDVSRRLVCSQGNFSRPPPLTMSALVASAE
jgi:hypothetical protein